MIGPKQAKPSRAEEKAAYEAVTVRDGGKCVRCGWYGTVHRDHRQNRHGTAVSNICTVELRRPQTEWLHTRRGLTHRIGTSDWRAEMHSTRRCSVDGCERQARSTRSLWCDMHRQRIQKYGTPDLPDHTIPLDVRFWAKVERRGDDDCWEWTAAPDPTTGYGRIGRGRRDEGHVSAHRLSYELNIGPIPEGLEIDHLCVNRMCVNPRHLEAVTKEENIRRAKRRWTHCIHGHEFTPENTYWRREGRRQCRQCRRDRRAQ